MHQFIKVLILKYACPFQDASAIISSLESDTMPQESTSDYLLAVSAPVVFNLSSNTTNTLQSQVINFNQKCSNLRLLPTSSSHGIQWLGADKQNQHVLVAASPYRPYQIHLPLPDPVVEHPQLHAQVREVGVNLINSNGHQIGGQVAGQKSGLVLSEALVKLNVNECVDIGDNQQIVDFTNSASNSPKFKSSHVNGEQQILQQLPNWLHHQELQKLQLQQHQYMLHNQQNPIQQHYSSPTEHQNNTQQEMQGLLQHQQQEYIQQLQYLHYLQMTHQRQTHQQIQQQQHYIQQQNIFEQQDMQHQDTFLQSDTQVQPTQLQWLSGHPNPLSTEFEKNDLAWTHQHLLPMPQDNMVTLPILSLPKATYSTPLESSPDQLSLIQSTIPLGMHILQHDLQQLLQPTNSLNSNEILNKTDGKSELSDQIKLQTSPLPGMLDHDTREDIHSNPMAFYVDNKRL